MADETTATPVEQAAEAAPTTEQAQPDATGEKAERVFKQSEVEALIRERLASAQRKQEEAANKARVEAERKAAEEQGQFQKLAESLKAELEQERQRARALELAGMRRDVAAKHQLPDGLAKRLQGETLEDLEKDAQDLLASIPKPAAPNINAGNAAQGGQAQSYLGGLTPQEFAARFGVRADLLGKQ